MGLVEKIVIYSVAALAFLFIARAIMKKRRRSPEEIKLVTIVVLIMGVGNAVLRFVL